MVITCTLQTTFKRKQQVVECRMVCQPLVYPLVRQWTTFKRKQQAHPYLQCERLGRVSRTTFKRKQQVLASLEMYGHMRPHELHNIQKKIASQGLENCDWCCKVGWNNIQKKIASRTILPHKLVNNLRNNIQKKIARCCSYPWAETFRVAF